MHFSAVTLVILLGCVIFILLASYTRRVTLIGQVVPPSGLVKIFSPQAGVARSISVKEGQTVVVGQELYRISSDRETAYGNTQALISETIAKRLESLNDELDKTRKLYATSNESLQRRITGLLSERNNIDLEIVAATTQQRLMAETAQAYLDLSRKNFVTREQYTQKQSDYLQAQSRLLLLRRDRGAADREINVRHAEILENNLKLERDTTQISRQTSTLSQDMAENEIRREVIISAPQAGVVTAINGVIGNTVDSTQPLLSLVPSEGGLHVELYASSKSIGFIEQGQKVRLRFAAFPFQKFGHVEGVIAGTTSAALQSTEIPGAMMANSGANDVEPLYKVDVLLSAQHISTYGKNRAFQHGMRVEGDVMLETRNLVEWMFDPLYSLTGKY